MKVIIKEIDKEVLEALDFLKDKEKIIINYNSGEILINASSVSKVRAVINLLFRLIKINEDLGRTLSKL